MREVARAKVWRSRFFAFPCGPLPSGFEVCYKQIGQLGSWRSAMFRSSTWPIASFERFRGRRTCIDRRNSNHPLSRADVVESARACMMGGHGMGGTVPQAKRNMDYMYVAISPRPSRALLWLYRGSWLGNPSTVFARGASCLGNRPMSVSF